MENYFSIQIYVLAFLLVWRFAPCLGQSNEWYLSGRGKDTSACGQTRDDPCKSLQQIISKINENATIYALDSGEEEKPLEICQDVALHLDKSFNLIGLGTRRQVIGCLRGDVNTTSSLRLSSDLSGDGSGETEELRDVFISVNNIEFNNVVFSLTDINVNLQNCHFTNASMNLYSIVGPNTLFISSCKWTGHYVCEPKKNCEPSGKLYAGGKITSFQIYKTEMYHTLLDLTVTTDSEIILSEVVFTNLENLLPVHGGAKIALRSVYTSTVKIIDCTFKNIYHWNPIYSVMNIFEPSLLLRFQDQRGGFYSPDHNNVSVLIRNTLFQNNERALTLQGNLENVRVENSVFRSNIAIHAGAAILLLTNRTVHVYNSTFENNAAGSFRVKQVRHPGDHFAVDGDEVQINSECCKGSISLIGKGGAVRVQKGEMTLEKCTLTNNTARLLGGAVFVDREAILTLKNTNFANSAEFKHSSQGDLLYSNGKVQINGANLHIKSANNHISVLQHSGEHWSMFLLDITIHCPIGHRLRVVNTSAYRVAPNQGLKRSYMLDQLSYFCESCPRHKYSTDRGYLRYKLNQGVLEYFTLMINGDNPKSDFDGVYDYHDISCKECPYGAICDTTIRALPNFWGYSHLENIRFSLCPKGYCCSSMKHCESYNVCQLNRRGRLCSQCKENYTEALFSSQCVPDHLCGPFWLWPFSIGMGFLYMLFLLFQKDIRDFIFSCPANDSNNAGNNQGESRQPTLCCLPRRKRRSVYETHGEQKERIMLNGLSGEDQEEALEMDVSSGGAGNTSADGQGKTPASSHVLEGGKGREDESPGEGAEPAPPAPASDNGAALLVIILYYFQDALLFHVKTVSSSTEHKSRSQLKALLLGFFKFRLEVAQFVDNVCAVEGLPPHQKLMMKTLLVPYVLLLFGLLYVAYKCLVCTKRSRDPDEKKQEDAFYVKISTGFMLCLLFTYQRLTITAFTLLNCVPVGEESILFIDGQVECYELWQYGVLAYAFICIVPFCCVLFLGPGLIKDGLIGLPQFFIACLVPLPFTIIWTIRRLCSRRKSSCDSDVQLSPETESVYKVLQAPFNDIEGTYIGPQCWSGVLIGRRLLLVVLYTFVNNTLIRILSMLFVSFLVLLHHVHVKPYKDSRANIAGSVSVSAMMLIGGINLVRAGFEAAEYTPQGPNKLLVKVMEETENVLMLWFPLAIMVIICIALIIKFTIMCHSITTKKNK